MSIFMCFILFIIYSFAGWLMETIYCSIADMKIANRGFLIGPICPIYGVGCVGITLLLSRFQEKPILVFLFAILLCSLLEYMTSFIMEKVFKTRWWDYTTEKFNINGRICPKTMLPFGFLALVVIYFVHPFIMNYLQQVPTNIINITSSVMFVLFTIDFLISSSIIVKFGSTIRKCKDQDSTEEVTKYVRDELSKKSFLYRRLLKAYPDFKAKVKKIIGTALAPLVQIQNQSNNEVDEKKIKKN